MGIRFKCPNGHQLNIKSFLAGKRGICPDCGVRFVIPMESGGVATIVHKGEKKRELPEGVAPATAAAPVAASAPAAVAVATPVVARPIVPVQTPATEPSANLGGAGSVPVAPAANPAATMPPAHDPFLDAPQASWYVRPRSGGQFGPALPEVMRRWITEGRVSRDSLVWRDGWADWKPAVETFPELADGADITGASDQGSPQPVSTAAARARARRSSNQLTLALVIVMIFLAIVLLAGLIFVVAGQNFSGPPKDALAPLADFIEGIARLA